ncbi:endolytic transglycosylase MltG [Candidatus Microgenomates bacterium]|nr:endolytic transglycosylase MltG [Candidatus Microgenomates bacterium]
MKRRILLTPLLLIILLAAVFYWWQQVLQPANSSDKKAKIFVVKKGENVNEVARNLEDEDLIRSKVAFFLFVKKEGAEKNIQAGTFRLSPSMSLPTILEKLSHGTLDIWITTIEGWRNEEIASLVEKELDIPSANFLKEAKSGYMFPDTYAVPKEASSGAVTKIMLDNFNKKFDQNLKDAVRQEGLTEEQAIVLASIVEREVWDDTDRPIVAGILLNRLKQGMPLQTDATVQYALGYQSEEKTWWKKSLTLDDLKVSSPYNTYLNAGLPPAPISNPGLAAIQAVAYPAKSDYLYYISDLNGQTHYAKTLDEHNENVRKYLRN